MNRPSNHADDQSPRSVAGPAARTPARQHLPAVDRALANLADLQDLVVGLALLRDPAVRRPWRETPLDPYARAELDDEARADRADRNELAPGEHIDAARPDVLDLLADTLSRAEDLAWHLSRAAWCPVLPPSSWTSATADPRRYLAHAAACLPTAVLGWENGGDIAHWAAAVTGAMLADLTAALALHVDGQTVKTICPWCKGGLAGTYTWRVRIVPGGEPAIVCESGTCQPPSRDVTTWWGGTPVWPLRDWPWLARRLAHLARRAAPATPDVPFARAEGATGRAGTPTDLTAARALLGGLVDEAAWKPTGTEG
ncbi:hypothetical protein [Thermomonospora cellulosilytica]|uniref:Uncharacterized protein n=1 Tax=Thermomonospora cellulosilytica TaxID=1411118 RepID=A0A7W3R8H8_9ACTN|nr:hypothetical protein [Thermomonospora cellulosilytica]MBA9003751.1 hypothetical protein [Thermomonospora cellulosilytica]